MNPYEPDDMFDPSDEFGESGRPEPISEAQKILQGLLAELPEQAQDVVAKVDREIKRIEEDNQEKIALMREEAERKVHAIESKAENRRKAMFQHAIEQLEPLQKDLFRSGDLEKALATFVQIRTLKSRLNNVLPDPGNLVRFEQVGKSFSFRVTGNNNGVVWGTDVYTSDSHLSTAAVHAGAVEMGEEGIVRVSIVDLAGVQVRDSFCNGVMTQDWGPYPIGYRVARADES